MPYGSVGSAAGDAFESSILARQKQQAEDIMQAMRLRQAESELATAKQDRELNELIKTQQTENIKADVETKKQKIHDAKVVDFMKRVPMKGMPWAPKLKAEGIELGIDVDGLIEPGKPAQALRFGGPSPAAVSMQVPAPEAPASLQPSEPLPPAPTVPVMGEPAVEATPDISLVPQDDLRRMSPEAAERELARRAATEDRERAAATATLDRQAGRDQSEALRRDLAAASTANAQAIAAGSLGLRRELADEKTADKNAERSMKLEGVRSMASETLRTIDQLVTKDGKDLTPGMKSRLGPMSRALRFYPGSETAKAETLRQQLQSQLVIELIGEMKQQSRSGATGFGALSGPELKILEATAGRLSTMQDEKQFFAALKDIRAKLNKTFMPASWEKDSAAGAPVQMKRDKNGKLVPVQVP